MVIAGERLFAADYVIAADGGRSTVRKCLGIEFEGYTWPERFLVITTHSIFRRRWAAAFAPTWPIRRVDQSLQGGRRRPEGSLAARFSTLGPTDR